MKAKILPVLGTSLLVLTRLSLSEEINQQQATNSTPQAPTHTSKPEKGAQYQIIGYLEKHDCVVTIKSGPNGTVYSIANRHGEILHENLSIEEVRAKMPELHDFLKTGNAGDARLRPIADASR